MFLRTLYRVFISSWSPGDDSFQPLDMTRIYIFYKLFEEEKMGKRGKIGGGVKEWRAATASWGKWCERERVDKCKEVNSAVQSAKNWIEIKRCTLCNANSNITKGENAKNMKEVQCRVQRSGKNCTVGRSEIVEKLTPSDNLPSFLCHRSEFEFGAVPKWKSRTRLKTKVEEDRCVGGSFRCLRHPDQMQQRGQKISLIKNCLPETIGSQVTVREPFIYVLAEFVR